MEAACRNSNVMTPVSILAKLVCLRLKVSFSTLGVADGGPQVIDSNSELQFASIKKLIAKAIIDKPFLMKWPAIHQSHQV